MSITLESSTPHFRVPFGDGEAQLFSAANGATLDVSAILRDPGDFHGNPNVHHIVHFGDAMKGLIGVFDKPESLAELGPDLTVLEITNPAAELIVKQVTELAVEIVNDGKLYDDKEFCKRYYDLAKKGYRLLREERPSTTGNVPVSLLRGGAVATRLDLGLKSDAHVKNEFLVETKRAHPKDGEHEDLMVTVRFPEGYDPTTLNGKDIVIPDFVNPASWASTAAFLIVLRHHYNVIPESVEHRSFIGTAQGVVLAARACSQMGIENVSFRMVGMSNQLNRDYYLVGNKVVADAGHALRHFLPSWLR